LRPPRALFFRLLQRRLIVLPLGDFGGLLFGGPALGELAAFGIVDFGGAPPVCGVAEIA
jgi:hypothetical protein